MALEKGKAPREGGQAPATAVGAEAPARFDPAVILGATGDQAAHTYALAASKMLAVGPVLPATKANARRLLRLALEHLAE